jgi:hypothetical protein
MKTLLWSVFGLFALLWTGLAWLMAEAARWFAGWMGRGAPADAVPALTDWRLPAWVLDWVDVGALQALQGAAVMMVDLLRSAGPWLGDAAGWLQPLVWGVWALGLLGLLLAAGALHLLLRLATPKPAPVAAGPQPGAV